MHFYDVDGQDLPPGAFLDFLAQAVNLRPLAADDDARARRVNRNLQLVSGPLDFDRRHARAA